MKTKTILFAVVVVLWAGLTPAFGATWNGTRWDFSDGPLVYKLFDNNAPAGWRDAVLEAIQEWDDLICTQQNFRLETDCTKPYNVYVGWPLGKDDGSGGVTEPLPASRQPWLPTKDTWAENANALGLAWPDNSSGPFEVDFNPHHDWRPDLGKPGGGSKYDLVQTAKHEWGHVLGLKDLPKREDSRKLMYKTGYPGVRKIVTYPDVGLDLMALGYDVHLQIPGPAMDEYDIGWNGQSWNETGYYSDEIDSPLWKDHNEVLRIDNSARAQYSKTVWLFVGFLDTQNYDPYITITTSSGSQPVQTSMDWSKDRTRLLMSWVLPDQPAWEELDFDTDTFFTMNGILSLEVSTYCSYFVPEPATISLLGLGALALLGLRRRHS